MNFSPKTDSPSTKKKTNYPNTAGLPCHPCLQQSHQQPWRPFSTGEANIQGIQVLETTGCPERPSWGDVSKRGMFSEPRAQLHRSKMSLEPLHVLGCWCWGKWCWVGFWTCSQHNFKRWWLLCLTYYSTPKQSISLWKDSHIFDLIKPLMVSHVQPEGKCVFINDVLLHSFSSLAHAFNQPLSCSVLCCPRVVWSRVGWLCGGQGWEVAKEKQGILDLSDLYRTQE